jgi:hypothetical protein
MQDNNQAPEGSNQVPILSQLDTSWIPIGYQFESSVIPQCETSLVSIFLKDTHCTKY